MEDVTTESTPCASCLLPVPQGMTLCPSCGAPVLPDRATPPVEPTLKQGPSYTVTDDESELHAPAATALQFAAAIDGKPEPIALASSGASVGDEGAGRVDTDRPPTRDELPFRKTRQSHGAMTAEGEGPTGGAPPDSEEATGLLPGDVVLRQYRIEKKLGAGGMGTVYLAIDDVSHQKVAIKALPASLAHDKAIVERFTQEARALAALDHPSIVPLITFANEGDDRFLVMKYIEGTNLDDLLGERHRLDFATAQLIFESVVDALGYAHQHGVVHRDIKPANVLLADDRRVYLVDFGIAKQEQGVKLTQTGMLMGTPQYMSPEQISGQPVDGRSDLYGAGLILYEMLTGQPPFTGEKTFAVLKAHVESKVPDPSKLRGETIPAHLSFAIAELLKKNPDERPQTAAEALALLAQEPTTAPEFGGALSLVESGPVNTPITTSLMDDDLPDFQRPAIAAWLLGGLLFFGGLGAFAWWALQPPAVAELPEPVADTVDQTPAAIDFMVDRAKTLIEQGEYHAALTLLEKGLNKHDALFPQVVAVRIEANIALKRSVTAQRWLDALKQTPNLPDELMPQLAELQEDIDDIPRRTPRRKSRKSHTSSSNHSKTEAKPATATKADDPPATRDDEKPDAPKRPDRFQNANAESSSTSSKSSSRDKPASAKEKPAAKNTRPHRGRRFQNANSDSKKDAQADAPKGDNARKGRRSRPRRFDNAQ